MSLRFSLANWLEKLVHRLQHGVWQHSSGGVGDHSSWVHLLRREIIEDPFGDVYEVHDCSFCGQMYLGKHLGNVLLEEVDGEVVYIGAFKADRLDPYIEQGYFVRDYQIHFRKPASGSELGVDWVPGDAS